MALAIVVSLQKPLPDAQATYGKGETGKALAREIDKLDFAARCKAVPGITSLLSESIEKLAEQMRAEGFDPAKMRLPPEKWFPAADGLKTSRALIEYVSTKLNDFK